MALTIKQDKFCCNYVLTGNASEAYRLAYSAENMKQATVHRKATELMQHGLISARIRDLQAAAQASFEITLEGQITRYLQLLNAAGNEIEDPRQRVDSMTRILSRLDKICGLEKHADQIGFADITIVMDDKDVLA